MQKIKYGEKELAVKSIVSEENRGINTISITFGDSVLFTDIQSFYDTSLNAESLRRMEIYNGVSTYEPVAEGTVGEPVGVTTWELQGVHIGYTKPVDLTCFGGIIKVKVEKELEIESKVSEQQAIIETLLLSVLGV